MQCWKSFRAADSDREPPLLFAANWPRGGLQITTVNTAYGLRQRRTRRAQRRRQQEQHSRDQRNHPTMPNPLQQARRPASRSGRNQKQPL